MNRKKESVQARARRELRFRIIAGAAIIIIVATAGILAYILLQPLALTMRIEPANISAGKYPVGSTFTVNVTVKNAVSITAIQLDVRYDSSVLIVTDLSVGQFLESVGVTENYVNYTAQSLNDTQLKRIFLANIVDQSVPNWSGSGTLFSMTFKVISNGSSPIQLYPYTENATYNEGTYLLRADNRSLLSPLYTNLIPMLDSGSYA